MLEQLLVRNFALSGESRIEFERGMTAITGETGAGKSLTVDALSMVLGERADASMVRQGREKAEIEAVFSLEGQPELKERLKTGEFLASDEDSLILRRTISADGKSRGYVNGHPATAAVLRGIGSALVAVHGQHAGILLTDKNRQLQLLDTFGGLGELTQQVNRAFHAYAEKREALLALSSEQVQGAQEFKTMRYELEELGKLGLEQGSYEQISKDYDAQMHASQTGDAVIMALGVLSDDEHNLIEILDGRIRDLRAVLPYDQEHLAPVIERLCGAAAELEKARDELADIRGIADPAYCRELEEKLSRCHELARRFGVLPRDLYTVTDTLEQKIRHFLSLKDEITARTAELRTLRERYEELAGELSGKRARAAAAMSEQVSAKIRELAMPDGIFKVELRHLGDGRPRPGGRDEAAFLFTANRGEPPRDLGTVASGGELSRLALAIEVLTSSSRSTPTLIFDEVDTGISGRTASAVGDLLSRLGKQVQVFTVTHLPQVAAAAGTQFLVSKVTEHEEVCSRIEKLGPAERVEEIARMLGGAVVTEAVRESARELLKKSGHGSA